LRVDQSIDGGNRSYCGEGAKYLSLVRVCVNIGVGRARRALQPQVASKTELRHGWRAAKYPDQVTWNIRNVTAQGSYNSWP